MVTPGDQSLVLRIWIRFPSHLVSRLAEDVQQEVGSRRMLCLYFKWYDQVSNTDQEGIEGNGRRPFLVRG